MENEKGLSEVYQVKLPFPTYNLYYYIPLTWKNMVNWAFNPKSLIIILNYIPFRKKLDFNFHIPNYLWFQFGGADDRR